MPLFTIGHSNITQEEFTRLLEAATIKIIADVRTRPYSGNNPQFNQQSLEAALVAKGIKYIHFPQLGGSPTGNEPGIFHHMKTTEGLEAIESLCALSKTDNVCVMCSEADWTECHRQVIATELQKKGFVITHLKRDGGKDQHPEVIRYPKWLIEHQDGDGIDQLQQSCTAHVEEVAEKKKRRWNKR
eukprot:GEMP01104342.1.p1 GENE.GEMP01104342.1~~GEMP01104342.1.p1  ORF type:complete len:186 (+),score=38.19 GEMP01104342.1:147-704(+)